jgi:hypothetical protein
MDFRVLAFEVFFEDGEKMLKFCKVWKNFHPGGKVSQNKILNSFLIFLECFWWWAPQRRLWKNLDVKSLH